MRQARVDGSALARGVLVLALIVGIFGMHAWSAPAHAETAPAAVGATPIGPVDLPAYAAGHALPMPIATTSSATVTGQTDHLLLEQPNMPVGHIGSLCLGLLTVSILIALLHRRAHRASPAAAGRGHPSPAHPRIDVDRQPPTLAELQVLRQ